MRKVGPSLASLRSSVANNRVAELPPAILSPVSNHIKYFDALATDLKEVERGEMRMEQVTPTIAEATEKVKKAKRDESRLVAWLAFLHQQ